MLRIIAGQARGRRLRTPKGRHTRPTADRVREALFNILGHRVVGSMVLDLFAGSGAVGLEALSRGASGAVFVDNNRAALACLAINLKETGFEDRGEIIATDVRRAIFDLKSLARAFDLIYIDPPYYQDWGRVILPAVTPLLLPGGIAVLETAAADFTCEVEHLNLFSQRVYGDTKLNIYQVRGD